jgi:dipeptidyl aminopeptidase/acylaminoacyl peptidase
MVVGHGGVWGIPTHYDFVLRRLAASGWAIAAPSCRGEGGSDGEVEFALGEVDDTLVCWHALAELPEVDPGKTWLLGSSHGAMVSLLALAREDAPAEIPGAVAISGVYDVASWLEWVRRTGHVLLEDPIIARLNELKPEELGRRSAVEVADRIGAPVFLSHGENDTMVPVEQVTVLAQAFERAGKTNWRLRIEPGADHEYIWAPGRQNAIATWREVLSFMEEHPGAGR